MSNTEQTKGTIGLVHGSGMGAWSWELLEPELAARGFETIAMDLPAYRPGATYDDYAKVAADALRPATRGGNKIDLLVAHSGGAHTVPGIVRRLGAGAIDGIAYVSGSLGRSPRNRLISATTALRWLVIPRQRNSPDFQQAVLQVRDDRQSDRVVFDPSKIEELFFNDCPPDQVAKAIRRMKPHARPKDEPPLIAHRLPGIAKGYILPNQDKIRDRTWAIRAAGALGMKLVEMEGGHSPAISRPAELADILAGMVEENRINALRPTRNRATQK